MGFEMPSDTSAKWCRTDRPAAIEFGYSQSGTHGWVIRPTCVEASVISLDRQRIGDLLALIVMAGYEQMPLSRKMDKLANGEIFVKAVFHDLTGAVNVKWPERRIADHGKR